MVDRTKPPASEPSPGDAVGRGPDHDEEAFRAKLASIARANREAAGLSPAQAARRAHISRAAVRDVESHKSWPRVDTLVAYARAIGTTPWALLHGAGLGAEAERDDPRDASRAEPAPVDLNAILRDAGVSEQTWRTAKALLEALVAAER